MAKKIGVSKNEMMELRKQGLSNNDIANVLEISRAAVYRYIGAQGGRMESLAAFNKPEEKTAETPKEEKNPAPKAVDSLQTVLEVVKSAAGTFRADVDYENGLVALFDHTVEFAEMAELATFIIGLAGRVNSH